MKPILDLRRAPADAAERAMWLGGVTEAVRAEMEEQWAKVYFDLRLSGRLDTAIALGLHSRRRILAYSRAENNSLHRPVRWNDGEDDTSSAYSGHSQ